MAQVIKQADIFGRIGTGIGKGLSEQVPKEIERYRMSAGLQQLEKDSPGLTPQQYYTRALQVPGLADKPQVVQSLGDLARQQAKGDALSKFSNENQAPNNEVFPKAPSASSMDRGSLSPSITKAKSLEKIQEGYIPPSIEERDAIASDAYNSNKSFFGNDPQKAIDWANQKIAQDEKINEAYSSQHNKLSALQDNIVSRLKSYSENLGVAIPSRVYSQIEDKAINAVKPKSENGKGLTEQEAIKEFGKELDSASRDFQAIETLGDWGISFKPAKETLSSIESLRTKFKRLGATEDFADKMVSENKFSPAFAYALAEPVKSVPILNESLKEAKSIKAGVVPGGRGLVAVSLPKKEDVQKKTEALTKKLAPLLGKEGSPLAVAYELSKKGYDPNIWRNYLIKNRDKLGLTEAQGRQLDKSNSLVGTWNDWWLSSFSGIE